MSSPIDIVTVGGANADFLIQGQRLPAPGTTEEGEAFHQGCGGKGANQSVAAARLGASVAFVGRVGADAQGQAQLAGLRSQGVDVSGVSVDERAPTGVALIMVDATGEKQIMTAPGANARLAPVHVRQAKTIILKAQVLLLQLEAPLAALEEAIELARQGGTRILLDPAPPQQLPATLLAGVDLLRSNAHEAEVLTGVAVKSQRSARLAAEQLIAQGVGAVVLGAPGGNLLVSEEGTELWLPHHQVRSVDATGAGDALAAGLATELARGKTLSAAAQFASAAAALKTTQLGAQAGLPHREQVERLLAAFN